MKENNVHYACPTYEGRPVRGMSDIELRGLLVTLLNEYSGKQLEERVVWLANKQYSKI